MDIAVVAVKVGGVLWLPVQRHQLDHAALPATV